MLKEERKRLQWASACISSFLDGAASSLDHAFGLVAPRGNRTGDKVWARRAAEIDRRGLNEKKAFEAFPNLDESTVRKGLAPRARGERCRLR